MRLPGAQADPAEVSPTGLKEREQSISQSSFFYLIPLPAHLVLADHVVAPAILLDGGAALGALLGVSGDPVGRFAVIVALLDPHLDEVAPERDGHHECVQGNIEMLLDLPSHLTGSCHFSEHLKQNTWLHLHLMGLASTVLTLAA